MLELQDVVAGYGSGTVLQSVSLEIGAGEIVGLLGRNGAGKTTAIRTILGLTRVTVGSVRFEGHDLTSMTPYRIPRLGIGVVPQEGRVFPELSVVENLSIGWMRGPLDTERLERVLESFPRLKARSGQRAGTLSGGEQQMLAIARALLMDPKLVLLDEPTEGLMPALVREIEGHIRGMKASGCGVLLAEQRVDMAIGICDRIVVLEKGRIVWTGTSEEGKTTDLGRYLGIRFR